jgi:hypothetical protein
VGIQNDHSLVYPLWANQASFDASRHQRSYLIVMNLQRAVGPSNCRFSDYSVLVEPGSSLEAPAWDLGAPYFVSPQVEGLEPLDE